VHYPRSLPKQPALSKWDKKDCPVADRLSSQVFALPMHHDLTDEHFRVLETALTKVAGAYRI
jgi:dTDP-4-amino-4,6-dideoxygalactose transaminase